jgi:hypothetical protein
MDQCDNCSFYRLITYSEQKSMGECRYKDPAPQGHTGIWPQVKPTDWCGEWAPLPADSLSLKEQYIRGAVALTDTSVQVLLANLARGLWNTVAMRSCQLVNKSTKNDCIVTFLDGPDEGKPIGYTSCGPYESKDMVFDPGIVAGVGRDICVKLDSNAPIFVTAQGFMLRGA